MSVNGTPACGPVSNNCGLTVSQLPQALTGCTGLNVTVASTAYVAGKPIDAQMRNLTLQQGSCGVLDWTYITPAGAYLTFDDCVSSESSSNSSSNSSSSSSETPACDQLYFSLRTVESMRQGDGSEFNELTGVLQPDNRTVRFNFDADFTACPGVYQAVFGIYQCQDNTDPSTACLVFSNTAFITINPGITGTGFSGPPTMPEIRLALRDSSPAESSLLGSLAFSDAELAAAIAWPVQLWNETPPYLNTYTTGTFPFRYHWLQAIIGHLFLLAAESNRRNNLNYSAAGVSVNDMDKEPQYEVAGQRRLEQYKQFVRAKKIEINLSSCYGTLG